MLRLFGGVRPRSRRHVPRNLVFFGFTALTTAVMVVSPVFGTSVARADAVITVTTTAQKIGGPGGCSLEEAILAANHDSSTFTAPGNDSVTINSACAAGNGSDTIVLAPGGVYQMGQIVDDLYNEMGPTATPVVTSSIVISGSGAVIERTTTSNVRAFAVGPGASLTLTEVDVRNFAAHGGHGFGGGGGGLGAGGAIYVHGGSLLVQESTFEGNSATGGDGSTGPSQGHFFGDGGGGGGLGGDGGSTSGFEGGGGGGSRGNGSQYGGGGGTLTDGDSAGGSRCGGDPPDIYTISGNGGDGKCDGGGGGGGRGGLDGDGGNGAYGGGGGGGDDDGGHGGFGGGGGGGYAADYATGGVRGGSGGDAGFGGGGGSGPGGLISGGPGSGGTFGGNATKAYGGGGAGLGGAIFGNSASILIVNSTFTGNYAVRGVAGGSGADNGADAGGAIFLVGGSLSMNSSTISGNDSTGSGAGIAVYKPTTGEATALNLYNTIVAGNGSSGGNHDECFVRGGVAVAGANNLVTPHAGDGLPPVSPCPGVTQTGDPLLGALASNAPGTTPTMALDPASPAVDAADNTTSPLNDQRGVGRPQGNGPDIGAYELITDFTAPVATPTQNPAANGHGWNNTAVTVSWNWADEAGGSGIDAANCTTSSTSSGEGAGLTLTATCSDLAGNLGSASHTVNVDLTAPAASPTQSPAANSNGWNNTAVTVNWNWADKSGGSGIDTTNCTTSSTTSGEGAAITLTATCNDLASNQGSTSHAVKVDLTPPKVTCAATPTFVIGSTSPGSVTATVTDGLSGPVSSPISAVATLTDLATAGVKSKSLTGYDKAGNSTTVSCPYIVAYKFLGFLQPIPQSIYQRGSAVPVKFRLGDASGNPISDAAALALLSPVCLVQVTFDDKVMGCATYDATGDYFQFKLKVPKSTSIGPHIVGVTVSAPDGSGIVNKESTPVAIGR